jgi:hypothetical protein
MRRWIKGTPRVEWYYGQTVSGMADVKVLINDDHGPYSEEYRRA